MRNAREKVSIVRRFGISAALVAGLVTAATYSARAHDAAHDARSHDKGQRHSAYPFYVAVKLDTRHGRHDAPALDQTRVMDAIARSLPSGVRLVDPRDRRVRPDMVLAVNERTFDLDFNVLNSKRASAPYRTGTFLAGCGPLYGASFVRVTEQATARYSYDVRVNNRFAPDHVATVHGLQSDSFNYGTGLTGHGACGTVAHAPMPASWVGDLFDRDDLSTRHGMADGIRRTAAEDMGRKIAGLIRNEQDRVQKAENDWRGHDRQYADARGRR
ncbi:hypothetical protein [Gimibacter soli]|uniref:Uncharacterized protein n=1 Tax=Gimibacter soli TaxID=3024400 RepID=A0AAE9XUY8_9PROT|nr:hypothetical protein [Gimibacter soli]WCL54168.1 hypothetical protein PH603_00155 [Gimibacter soli]